MLVIGRFWCNLTLKWLLIYLRLIQRLRTIMRTRWFSSENLWLGAGRFGFVTSTERVIMLRITWLILDSRELLGFTWFLLQTVT
ncbi:hypothetical protein LINPERHAP2_LOCUS6265 [Linum perenne]